MAVELTGSKPTRPTLVYALHSGNLYGTERMALHTAAGLADSFDPVFLSPPGPILEEATKLGFRAAAFSGVREFTSKLAPLLSTNRRLAFLGTGVMHSAVCLALNKIYRRRLSHLHVVHGGACERLSYGRKRFLNGQPVAFVAVSHYVRDRLIANGVRLSQISVIENFLPASQAQTLALSSRSEKVTGKQVIVISRLDPEKRVSLLLDALELTPDLRDFKVSVFGTGWELEALRNRAERANLNIQFQGFHPDVAGALSKSNLLVHLCPVEPFGLAILEALAADVPVLVPDAGGAGSLIEDNRSGFHFRANSAQHLAQRLREVLSYRNDRLADVVAEGRSLLQTRFAASPRIADYRRLLAQGLA